MPVRTRTAAPLYLKRRRVCSARGLRCHFCFSSLRCHLVFSGCPLCPRSAIAWTSRSSIPRRSGGCPLLQPATGVHDPRTGGEARAHCVPHTRTHKRKEITPPSLSAHAPRHHGVVCVCICVCARASRALHPTTPALHFSISSTNEEGIQGARTGGEGGGGGGRGKSSLCVFVCLGVDKMNERGRGGVRWDPCNCQLRGAHTHAHARLHARAVQPPPPSPHPPTLPPLRRPPPSSVQKARRQRTCVHEAHALKRKESKGEIEQRTPKRTQRLRSAAGGNSGSVADGGLG